LGACALLLRDFWAFWLALIPAPEALKRRY
jgi:hypothetical protein